MEVVEAEQLHAHQRAVIESVDARWVVDLRTGQRVPA